MIDKMPISIKPEVSFVQVMQDITAIKSQLPATGKKIVTEAGNVFYKNAVEHVHEYKTGDTKKSFKITVPNNNTAIITAGKGAYWEERRKGFKPPPRVGTGTGPHKFSIAATTITKQEFPRIITVNIDQLLARYKIG